MSKVVPRGQRPGGPDHDQLSQLSPGRAVASLSVFQFINCDASAALSGIPAQPHNGMAKLDNSRCIEHFSWREHRRSVFVQLLFRIDHRTSFLR